PPLRAPIEDAPPHLFRSNSRVEGFGIERPAGPRQKPVMVFMFGIGDGVQKLLVAPGAAHVFRRTRPCTLQADRIPLAPLGPQAALEQHLMPPVVPEVVVVLETESLARPRQDVTQLRGGGVAVVEFLEVLVQ